MLKENEEIFDLECQGLRIIQNKSGYAFTTDAVLLANTVRAKSRERVAELGAGSGVITLLLAKKTKAAEFFAVEIQERLADMCARSVALNGLQEKIKVICADMREQNPSLVAGSFDVVCCNPPYMPFFGDKECASEVEICKSEVMVTLAEAVQSAARLLKYGGRFYAIVKTERTTDLICAMRNCAVEPKVVIPVQPTPYKDIDTVIIEGRKNGNSGLKILKPLVIADADGNYTEPVRRMYGK